MVSIFFHVILLAGLALGQVQATEESFFKQRVAKRIDRERLIVSTETSSAVECEFALEGAASDCGPFDHPGTVFVDKLKRLAEEGDRYAQFLAALYSLEGRNSFGQPAERWFVEVELQQESEHFSGKPKNQRYLYLHPLILLKECAENGLPEAAHLFLKIIDKTPDDKQGAWKDYISFEETIQLAEMSLDDSKDLLSTWQKQKENLDCVADYYVRCAIGADASLKRRRRE